MGVSDFLPGNDKRTHRPESVKALGVNGRPEITVLGKAEVIEDGIAADIVKRLFLFDAGRRPANHESQACPGVDMVHGVRARHFTQVSRQRIWRLDKKYGLLRRFIVRWLMKSVFMPGVMFGVIQCNTDHGLIGDGQ